MKRFLPIFLLSILIFGFPLSGYSQNPSPTKYGGILKLGSTRPSASFGIPWKLRQGDRTTAMIAMEFLVRRGQKPGTYEGRLAEKWELAPDKSSYTFYLRKGVKFHDGTPFNSDAVKWNFEKDKAAGRPQFKNVTSIDVIDDYTVRIKISQWNSEFLHNFASDTDCALIISPTAYEKNGEDWANTHPVGTGPFRLKDYKQNQYTIFEKNPDYWEKGVPYLDEIQIVAVPDPVTFEAAIRSGELDGNHSSIDFVTGSTLKATRKINVWVSFGNLGSSLSFNAKNPSSIWTDKKMRQVLEYAIDKAKICQTLTYGFCKPTYEIIRGIHGAGEPGTIPRKYDPAKAKQLMTKAGHPTLSGINLEYNIADKASFQDAYLAIQKNLADVGIQVNLKPIELATFNQISFEPPNGNDLRIDIVRGDPLFPLVRVIEDLAPNTMYFPGAVRPQGFQQLIDEASATVDSAKVLNLCMQMEKLAYEDVMYVSLWSRPMLSAMNSKVHDADGAYGQVPYPYYERAWKEK